MRIAHLTDLHVQRAPRLRDLRPKRILGSANLYLGGRRSHFTSAVQQAAVDAVCALDPDLTLVTGDLTAQGLDAEFAETRRLLTPLADRCPLYLIPGNHDLYVDAPDPAGTMRHHLGEWMSPAAPGLALFGEVGALYIETCAPTWLSSGRTDLDQLSVADDLLRHTDAFVFLLLHYPLLDRHGAPYGPAYRANAQASDILAWLHRQDRIGAVLHGHEHHGFRATVPSEAGPIPVLNPGASGYAWLPKKRRTAHFNVYTVTDGQLTDIERHAWDGTAFRREADGAYASGG